MWCAALDFVGPRALRTSAMTKKKHYRKPPVIIYSRLLSMVLWLFRKGLMTERRFEFFVVEVVDAQQVNGHQDSKLTESKNQKRERVGDSESEPLCPCPISNSKVQTGSCPVSSAPIPLRDGKSCIAASWLLATQ